MAVSDERRARATEWAEVFGSPPPKYLSAVMMARALDYEAQCRSGGGLPASLRKVLAGVLKDAPMAAPMAVLPRSRLEPGAVLVREWNGRTWRVTVTKTGFSLDGRAYRSLSAIAREITGAGWSGPRFFGLRPRSGS